MSIELPFAVQGQSSTTLPQSQIHTLSEGTPVDQQGSQGVIQRATVG